MAYQSYHCSATQLCSALPASVSLFSHIYELSDILLYLCMCTSNLSSSLIYSFLFLASSSALQLLHNMLLHACITQNHIPHILYVLCFYILYAPFASLVHNSSACSLQSLFFPNRLFTVALPHTCIAPHFHTITS
jgi:hypothetical protein